MMNCVKRWKTGYAGKTLHQKVKYAILGFALLPLILIASIAFHLIYRNQVGKIRQEVYTEMQNMFADMQYEMNTIELMAKTIWSDTTFTTEVGQVAVNENMSEYGRYLFKVQTLSSLRIIASIGPVKCARLHLDYPGLREYANCLHTMDRAADSLWYADRDDISYNGKWYLNSLDDQPFIFFSSYYVEKNMASYVMPVKISNRLTGIFEIVLPMDSLVQGLYEENDTKDIFLVDAQERILGSRKLGGVLEEVTLESLLGIMELNSLADYDGQGVRLFDIVWKNGPVILSVAKDEKTGIMLMQLTDVGKQYRGLLMEMLEILLLEILMIVILFRAINNIVGRLLRDFEVFAGCMKEVEKGNLDVEIPRLKQVEVNAMAEEYNRMLKKVKELMEHAVHREVMIKEAQIRSLEKQIDSHFLYNVLDSIKMMAEVKGIYNVADALLALGRMFRYNLQADSHSVTLKEEITYLESYLNLCNIRYDYHINFSGNVEEAVKRLEVPKVILQPIAENSIVHGLDELAEDTTVYLKAYCAEGGAYIEMTDMGKGMDEETLERIRGIIRDGGEETTPGEIGLRNIHERIQLMYGKAYGVEL